MADKKKEVPKHIKEFYAKGERVKKILDTTEAAHSEAYQKGLVVITDKKTGEIDYTQLKDTKNQDAMLDKMMEHYLSRACQALKVKIPEDGLEQDIILQQYAGITRGELKRVMREAKENYTLQQHENIRDSLMKKQRGKLLPLRASHFDDSHIEDILAHTGTKDYVTKDTVGIERATGLLDLYQEKGEISLSDLERLSATPEEKGGWGSKAYLTDKAKKAVKDLKDKYKEAK